MNENKFSGSVNNNIWSVVYPYLFGLFVVMAIIILLSLLATAIFYFSDIGEAYLRPAGILISAIAMFSGGFALGRKSQNHGLLGGFILGLIFIAFITLIALFTDSGINSVLNKLVYLILASTIGGICGIK